MKTFTSHSSARRFRPSLDLLEARVAPAVSIVPDGSTLTITSDEASDRVQIVDNGDGDLRIWVNGVEQSRRFDISRLVIRMGAGNDRVEYTQRADRSRAMDLDASLQDGSDEFTATSYGDIRPGADLAIRVHGGKGQDTIRVYMHEDVDVSYGAVLRLNLEGGRHTDTIFVLYDGELDGQLQLRARGNEGVDNMTVWVQADAGSIGSLRGLGGGRYARVQGNDGDDTLEFKVWAPAGVVVNAILQGGDGTDTGTFTDNVEYSGLEFLRFD